MSQPRPPTSPPSIPSCSFHESGDTAQHHLLWVHTGTAHIHLPDEERPRDLSLIRGTGVWIPTGTPYAVCTEPGTVAFPTLVPLHVAPSSSRTLATFDVQVEHYDWLIAYFAHAYTTYNQTVHGDLFTILDGATGSTDMDAPALPRSKAGRRVAEELIRNPSIDHSLAHWASLVASSQSTLRRQFSEETGLTFAQWRTKCRISAAKEFLRAGYSVTQVATRVGFRSRNGFTRAFHAETDLPPREFAKSILAAPSAASRPRIVADREAARVASLRQGPSGPARALPSGRSGARRIPYHVLTWMYRGTGSARVGDDFVQRKKGDTLWLPAHVERDTHIDGGSLSLPIAVLTPDEAHIETADAATFPANWDRYFLYCCVSANSPLRPSDYDPRFILKVFREQVTLGNGLAVPQPVSGAAREYSRLFLNSINDGLPEPRVSSHNALHRDFLQQTGIGLNQWKLAVRMHVARRLLETGIRSVQVARRLGYSAPSNFSRAFTRFHGQNPTFFRVNSTDPGGLPGAN